MTEQKESKKNSSRTAWGGDIRSTSSVSSRSRQGNARKRSVLSHAAFSYGFRLQFHCGRIFFSKCHFEDAKVPLCYGRSGTSGNPSISKICSDSEKTKNCPASAYTPFRVSCICLSRPRYADKNIPAFRTI